MKAIKRRMSISTQLTILALIALTFSTCFFFAIHALGSDLIAEYLYKTGYVDTVANGYLDDFEEYVNKNEISSTDKTALDAWVKEKKIIYLEIYNRYIDDYVYMSNEPTAGKSMDCDAWAANEAYERVIKFKDGERYVGIYGNYTYKFFYYALAAELITAFALFVLILTFILKRSIAAIKNFKNEIEILEGGNLEYELTLIGGNNELSELSISIENLRKSILVQFEKEDELKRINNKVITDLSHDIRTPLTTITIYSDAIKHKKYRNEDELKQYLTKIEDKLSQMKHLTDTILEYSLETVSDHHTESTTDSFTHVFSDRLSGFIECLEQSGIQTETRINRYDDIISVYENDIDRIFDNILSNIMKYADRGFPVIISSDKKKTLELTFENTKPPQPKSDAGHNLGIGNICKLMDKIGGECIVEETASVFKITLKFLPEN